ncbi:hypothetical protein GIB67_024320 [Kingdonia uniflora]|uniref:KIB1-4 beta-propeller domain-containing protein n=1 Tax=Kingdonia uniflora TaxID=39325 RepID=A0A7J7LEZ1_9MAGN|nr:hypothetical protein GIB67_024320 [Kingdonia uniflora]
MDPVTKCWVGVKTLCGQMIFLGFSSAVSVSVSNYLSCKPNCIYYASKDKVSDRRGMQVFNVEDGSLVANHIKEQKMFVSPCIWIQPTLQQRSKISTEPTGIFTRLQKVPSIALDVGNVTQIFMKFFLLAKAHERIIQDRKRQVILLNAQAGSLTAQLDKYMMKVNKKFLSTFIEEFSKINMQKEWSLADALDVQKILENLSDPPEKFKIIISNLIAAVNEGLIHLKLVENVEQEYMKLSVEQSRQGDNVDSVQLKVEEEMRAAAICFGKAKETIAHASDIGISIRK